MRKAVGALFRLVFGSTIEEWINPPRVTGIRFLDQILLGGILRILRWSLLIGFGFFLYVLAIGVLGQGDPLGRTLGVATFSGLVMAVVAAVMFGALRLLVWIIGLIRKERGGS